MNKILVEVSVGELLDKISILEIKKEKISDPESLKIINSEYLVLKEQLKKNIKTNSEVDRLFDSLKEINSKLWLIEDDKRMCEKNSDFGEKFIKLSRDVHFLILKCSEQNGNKRIYFFRLYSCFILSIFEQAQLKSGFIV